MVGDCSVLGLSGALTGFWPIALCVPADLLARVRLAMGAFSRKRVGQALNLDQHERRTRDQGSQRDWV